MPDFTLLVYLCSKPGMARELQVNAKGIDMKNGVTELLKQKSTSVTSFTSLQQNEYFAQSTKNQMIAQEQLQQQVTAVSYNVSNLMKTR
ncbi:hypothetical protein BC830DRAFT_1151316 [Chytriomyces sp. MP71]|nr:hypothetical protein BC830DRAFT_1151316 [Chytriomyces sp. MP71]